MGKCWVIRKPCRRCTHRYKLIHVKKFQTRSRREEGNMGTIFLKI